MSAARICAVAKITNKRGLHARASAKIVEAAARFKSQITVTKDGQIVEARSIMGLMMLAASMGSEIEICAEGEDAEAAVVALLALADAKFGEDCTTFRPPRVGEGQSPTNSPVPAPRWKRRIHAVAAAGRSANGLPDRT